MPHATPIGLTGEHYEDTVPDTLDLAANRPVRAVGHVLTTVVLGVAAAAAGLALVS